MNQLIIFIHFCFILWKT